MTLGLEDEYKVSIMEFLVGEALNARVAHWGSSRLLDARGQIQMATVDCNQEAHGQFRECMLVIPMMQLMSSYLSPLMDSSQDDFLTDFPWQNCKSGQLAQIYSYIID